MWWCSMPVPDREVNLHVQIRAGESGALSEEDIVPNRPSVLVFSRKGYVKRMPADLFATQVNAHEGCSDTTELPDVIHPSLHLPNICLPLALILSLLQMS